jgi:hypothetical protein
MVDIVREDRDDQDSAEFRGYPSQSSTQAAAVDAPVPSKTAEFVAGTTPAADAGPSTISSAVHVTGSCPACTSGDPHWTPGAAAGPNQQ